MLKIQHITISDPDSETPSVQLTIADAPSIDDCDVWLTACVSIDRVGESLENIEQSALDKTQALIESARAVLRAKY